MTAPDRTLSAVPSRWDRAVLAVAGWVLNLCTRRTRNSLVQHIRSWRPS